MYMYLPFISLKPLFETISFNLLHPIFSRSASSEVASFLVPNELPPSGSIVVSTAAIAGMAGGLAFLLVTATLSVAAVHLVKRRSTGNGDRDRDRDKKKFHSIKYIDARHANGHHHPHLRAIHIEHLSGASV